jgi:hypothetical protein
MMNYLRHTALAMSISLIGAITAPVVQASPEFVNGLALDGAMLDRSGGTDANNGRVGYFSDIYYDPQRHQWWGLSDRGPGGGTLHYQTRVQFRPVTRARWLQVSQGFTEVFRWP